MAIAVTVLFITLLSALFGAVLSLLLTQQKAIHGVGAQVQARYAAEAGIAVALAELNREAGAGGAWEKWNITNETRVGLMDTNFLAGGSVPAWGEIQVSMASTAIRATGYAKAPGIATPFHCTVTVETQTRSGVIMAARWREE